MRPTDEKDSEAEPQPEDFGLTENDVTFVRRIHRAFVAFGIIWGLLISLYVMSVDVEGDDGPHGEVRMAVLVVVVTLTLPYKLLTNSERCKAYADYKTALNEFHEAKPVAPLGQRTFERIDKAPGRSRPTRQTGTTASRDPSEETNEAAQPFGETGRDCPSCGNPLMPYDSYCPHCGLQLAKDRWLPIILWGVVSVAVLSVVLYLMAPEE
jgi:hypothetical protein